MTTVAMSENNRGLRSLLQHPDVYLALQWALGLKRLHAYLIRRFVRETPGFRILDIGCGPGTLRFSLPDVEYHGFDLNPDYIRFANRRFGNVPNSRFWCKAVTDEPVSEHEKYDLVLAIGVLHHLGDAEALHLCRLAQARLKTGARFVTADCCFSPGQNPVARFLISRDRGQNVRYPEGYRRLATPVFEDVRVNVEYGLMHVPYTHAVMEMVN
jgi:SAM-dependent methyltransferase